MRSMRRVPRAVAASAALSAALVGTRIAGAVGPPGDEDKVLPCRPTIACTADVVPPGVLEIETGLLGRKLPDARQLSTPFLFKLTTAEWLQVQVGSNGWTIANGEVPTRYLDDATVGAKVHFLDQTASRPALAVSATASIPTFSDQPGYLRTYDALFTAYATKDFGWLHVDANVGANIWRVEKAPRTQAWVAVAMSTELPARFGAMIEGYAFTDATPVAPRDGGVLSAVTYAPASWLILDVGGDVGLFPSERVASVFVGATFIPMVLWPRGDGRGLARR